jgi:hypothetical protein
MKDERTQLVLILKHYKSWLKVVDTSLKMATIFNKISTNILVYKKS